MRPSRCRYGCGSEVYRFTDVGIPRQVEASPIYAGADLGYDHNMLWRWRGKHVGWVSGSPFAETVYLEHDCDNTPKHLKPSRPRTDTHTKRSETP